MPSRVGRISRSNDRQKARRFDEVLWTSARVAISREPVLATLHPRSATVAVAQRAFRRPHAGHSVPPFAALLSVARGGADVRVRLYLWLWAVTSARQPAPYQRTTGSWAELLNLVEDQWRGHPEKRSHAARRVATAMRSLEDEMLVRRLDRDTIRLCDPDRSGTDYHPWTDADVAVREAERREIERRWQHLTDFRVTRLWEDPPLRVPIALWLNGTVSALPAPALVALLVLLDHRPDESGVIWVPKTRTHEYCVRRDSWYSGLRTLEDFGCVHRVEGPLLIARGVNKQFAPDGRRRVGWKLNTRRLYGLRRERD